MNPECENQIYLMELNYLEKRRQEVLKLIDANNEIIDTLINKKDNEGVKKKAKK